jgi:hypothetical protein
MNKSIYLLVALIALIPFGVYAQTTTIPKDTLPSLNAGDIEDDFATSIEMSKKIIIVDQKDVLIPKEYAKKELKFFFEHEPTIENKNYAIVDLPEEYTGFKVELLRVEFEQLPDDDIIFYSHGNVVEEPLDEKNYAYLIGNFATESEATEFMDTFLLELYPDARVISYEKGQRN